MAMPNRNASGFIRVGLVPLLLTRKAAYKQFSPILMEEALYVGD